VSAQNPAKTVEQLIEVGRMAVDRSFVLASGGNLSRPLARLADVFFDGASE